MQDAMLLAWEGDEEEEVEEEEEEEEEEKEETYETADEWRELLLTCLGSKLRIITGKPRKYSLPFLGQFGKSGKTTKISIYSYGYR